MMSKSSRYHLHFRVAGADPRIDADTDASGSTINGEVASFMRLLGERMINLVLSEIRSLSAFTTSNDGYSIIGSYDETVEIHSPPARAVFNKGGEDVVIPLQDFIDMLHEWKAFLNGLPHRHSLSGQ